MTELTRAEVESWPAPGPTYLDPTRVLALFDKIEAQKFPTTEELEYARAMGTLGKRATKDQDLSDYVYAMAERVKALEKALLDACREKVLHGHTTQLLNSALRLMVPGVENYEEWGDERQSRLQKAEARVEELEKVLDGYGARDMESLSKKLKDAEVRIANYQAAIRRADDLVEKYRQDLLRGGWTAGKSQLRSMVGEEFRRAEKLAGIIAQVKALCTDPHPCAHIVITLDDVLQTIVAGEAEK